MLRVCSFFFVVCDFVCLLVYLAVLFSLLHCCRREIAWRPYNFQVLIDFASLEPRPPKVYPCFR